MQNMFRGFQQSQEPQNQKLDLPHITKQLYTDLLTEKFNTNTTQNFGFQDLLHFNTGTQSSQLRGFFNNEEDNGDQHYNNHNNNHNHNNVTIDDREFDDQKANLLELVSSSVDSSVISEKRVQVQEQNASGADAQKINDNMLYYEDFSFDQLNENQKYSSICPYCLTMIDSTCEVSAYYVFSVNKFYLCHMTCSIRLFNIEEIKNVSTFEENQKTLLLNHTTQNEFDPSNYIRDSSKKFYSIKWNFQHPISKKSFGQIEKTANILEHASHGIRLMYLNLSNKLSNSVFEPNLYIIPCWEFSCKLWLYESQSVNQPVEIEFYVDLTSKHDKTPQSKIASWDIISKINGNFILIEVEIVPFSVIEEESNYKLDNYLKFIEENQQNSSDIQLIRLKSLQINLPIKTQDKMNASTISSLQQQLSKQPSFANKILNPQEQFFHRGLSQNSLSENRKDMIQSCPVTNSNQSQKQSLINQLQGTSSTVKKSQLELQQQVKFYPPQNDINSLSSFSNLLKYPQQLEQQQQQNVKLYQSGGIQQQQQQQQQQQYLFNSATSYHSAGGQNISGRSTKLPSTDKSGGSKQQGNDSNSPRRQSQDPFFQQLAGSDSSNNNSQMKISGVSAANSNLDDDSILAGPEIDNIRTYLADIVKLAKTHQGSRMLQKFFTKCKIEDIALTYEEIKHHLKDLLLDQYANFMFKNLTNSLPTPYRIDLLKRIQNQIVDISRDRKGTHSLQAILFDVPTEEEQLIVMQGLYKYIKTLAFDSQATHFIQKIVSLFNENVLLPILQNIIENFVEYANNQCGLCVLKASMSKYKGNQQYNSLFVQYITVNLEYIVQNPFGNYVIQHALEIYSTEQCQPIFTQLLNNQIQFSLQKFSSNVIEKCLTIQPKVRRIFVDHICKDSYMTELMKNKYGNFVLTKALNETSPEEISLLNKSLARNLIKINIAKYKTKWSSYLKQQKQPLQQKHKFYLNEHDLQQQQQQQKLQLYDNHNDSDSSNGQYSKFKI